jgi:hypothetical protein
MSRLVSNALKRHFLRSDNSNVTCSPELRIAISCGLLQYALLRYDCKLDSWSAECLELATLRMASSIQQGQKPKWPGFEKDLGKLRDDLLRIIGTLAVSLAQGQRNDALEAELIAWVYDHHGGVHLMSQLRADLNPVFTWIALDAQLRSVGNDSGFRLGNK